MNSGKCHKMIESSGENHEGGVRWYNAIRRHISRQSRNRSVPRIEVLEFVKQWSHANASPPTEGFAFVIWRRR